MVDKPHAFIRCNMMSPVTSCRLASTNRVEYRLEDGNHFTLDMKELTSLVDRLGYTVRLSPALQAQSR